MSSQKQIQWFPGHMTKAKRLMEQSLKLVDFVIEIRDARIPLSSKNPMLDSLIQSKPRLIILSKADKADPEVTKKWIESFESDNQRALALDLIHDNFEKPIIATSKQLCSTWLEKQKRRGIRPRALRAMVCGIPNVGKSTMINTIARRKAAKTANTPGVTKSLQWIRFGKDIELLDTPGVLWPKFEDQEIGLKLALLGSIRDEVLSMDELALYACQWLMETMPNILKSVYHIEIQDSPYETLKEIAKKRGYLIRGDIDDERLMKAFVKDIRDGKLGRISWELPVHD